MATKKVKREIVLEQDNGKNGGISVVGTLQRKDKLMDTSSMSLSQKLGAIILGGLLIDTLKTSYDSLVQQLEDTPEEDVINQLIAEGVLNPGETPVISVIDRAGIKHSGTLGTSVTSKFHMEDFKKLADDPDIFDALPDEYKEIKLRGAAFFKKLFTDGALGTYEKYFSNETENVTKIKGIKAFKPDGTEIKTGEEE